MADQHKGETIVVVAHGGVIEGTLSALAESLRPRLRGRGREHVADRVGTSRRDRLLRRPARWHLVRFNDSAHLLD